MAREAGIDMTPIKSRSQRCPNFDQVWGPEFHEKRLAIQLFIGAKRTISKELRTGADESLSIDAQ